MTDAATTKTDRIHVARLTMVPADLPVFHIDHQHTAEAYEPPPRVTTNPPQLFGGQRVFVLAWPERGVYLEATNLSAERTRECGCAE